MSATVKAARYWELDALRGFAVVEMVFFHFMWDLAFFGLSQADMLGAPWQIFARNIGATFIFVMGVSLTISHTKAKQRAGHSKLFLKFLRRGGQIFGLGLLVTIATYFFIGRGFVIFGILHLIGLSIILAYPFLGRSKWLSLVAGSLVIGVGVYLNTSVVVTYPWLIWLGVTQAGIYMVDFYPVLPWFGVALLGIFVGYTLYPEATRRFAWPNWSQVAVVRGLRFLGRHSLLIYLVHQPVLIAIFIALGYGPF